MARPGMPIPRQSEHDGVESALSAAKGSRSELSRQVAVDLKPDADLHKDRSGPGHCWFPKVCLSGMILLRDAQWRKPVLSTARPLQPGARPLVDFSCSLPSRAQAGISRKRSPGNEGARIGQIEVRKGIGLEKGPEGIVVLVEQVPHQSENLDVLGDLI
jgi:hypothetical protein